MPLSLAVIRLAETCSKGRLLSGHGQVRRVPNPERAEIRLALRTFLCNHLCYGSGSHAKALEQQKRRCIPQPGKQNSSDSKVAEEGHGILHTPLRPVQASPVMMITISRKKRVKGFHHIIVAGEKCTDLPFRHIPSVNCNI